MPRTAKSKQVKPVEKTGIDYSFLKPSEETKFKWRDCIDPSFLYINERYYTSRNKDIPQSVAEAEDDGVIVRLIGLRDLARRHGYKSISYRAFPCESGESVIGCRIDWSPSSYNGNREVATEGIASVNRDNIFGAGIRFKEANASNRAFARAVREYFCIFSVCEDELDKPDYTKGGEQNVPQVVKPSNQRSNKVLERSVSTYLDFDTFFEFKERFLKQKVQGGSLEEDVLMYESYEEIPTELCKKLTALVKKASKEKESQEEEKKE